MQDLFPWPWIESGPPALGVRSLSHWITKKSLPCFFLLTIFFKQTKKAYICYLFLLPYSLLLLSFFFDHTTWHVGSPWPGIEPMTPTVEAWRLNHWTTREVHIFQLSYCYYSTEINICHERWLTSKFREVFTELILLILSKQLISPVHSSNSNILVSPFTHITKSHSLGVIKKKKKRTKSQRGKEEQIWKHEYKKLHSKRHN